MAPISRRQVLQSLGAGVTVGVAGCASGTPGSLGLEPIASGLTTPVDMAFPPDLDLRYVGTQPGVIFVHDANGLADESLLDLRDSVVAGGEKGLLGLALHPDFDENRRLFVRYSAPTRAGTPGHYSHTFVLAEFEATEDGRQVRPDTERTVLEIPQPQGNHNAGTVAFGPEDALYVAVGDGGGANDQGTGHVQDWYDDVLGGNGQDVTENLLGSMLRIDVDHASDEPPSDRGENTVDFTVPRDNPLVGQAGLNEYFAWGLRNPWRMAFDEGRLIVGDVGQNRFEEVNLVENGGNYGWNVKEGRHCFQANGCPEQTPADVRGGEPLVDPVIEYPHSGEDVNGISVIGGEVYRGDRIPSLDGQYVFGDLQADDQLFMAEPAGDNWSADVISLDTDAYSGLQQLISFARDPDGEIYVLGDGAVYELVSAGNT